jgi:hypothetical protein
MGVTAVPLRLRLATTAILMSIPLAALETIIISRAPWWRLPLDRVLVWSIAVALLCIPQAVWISQGRRWAFWLTCSFAALWTLLSAWVALRTSNASLGFFAAFLALYYSITLSWVRREIGRSFVDPGIRWYEGLPRPIPGLDCQLVRGTHGEHYRVSRLDRDGAFIFRKSGTLEAASISEPSELVFSFRGRTVSCQGTPVSALDRGDGMGFRFVGIPADRRKELGDFVERLRGEGHV